MPLPLSADQVLDRYFLEMRCKVLDVAAALDRLDRAGETDRDVRNDSRIEDLRAAVNVLLDDAPRRAERIQMIFSDKYQQDWQHPEH